MSERDSAGRPLDVFVAENPDLSPEFVHRVWMDVSELADASDGATDRQLFLRLMKVMPGRVGGSKEDVERVVRWCLGKPARRGKK